eukprot:TRINITY_DN24614_c0_g1_i1.p1 TRINITY_DN24614_c0_g1~~TRINITY_DN24614_c0_g1_i1.p1  ORF type:complete len:462 (-),score=61.81 TRINITY_DN24614_c0_g1_i1:35-1420(-)
MRHTISWLGFRYLFDATLGAASPIIGLTRRPAKAPKVRRLTSIDADEARLHGDLDNYMVYHVDVLVGTPGASLGDVAALQQQHSIVLNMFQATSSVQLIGLLLCGASSTFRWTPCSDCSCTDGECRYGVSYVEGSSIKGRFFEDVIHFGHAERQNRKGLVQLGCHSLETRLFKTQPQSGILGLGTRAATVMEALAEGPLEKEVLTMCLSEQGGAMTLGSMNTTWTPIKSPVQWIPYTGNYYVSIDSLDLVSGHKISKIYTASIGKAVMDSGTTYTYFTAAQAQRIRLFIRNACISGGCQAAEDASCWNLDGGEAALENFPLVRFRLDGVVVDWTPHGYLQKKSESRYCYTFFGEPPLTLGASFMMHHLVVFDKEESKIGIAPAHCPTIRSRDDPVTFAQVGVVSANLRSSTLDAQLDMDNASNGSTSSLAASMRRPSLVLPLMMLSFVIHAAVLVTGMFDA